MEDAILVNRVDQSGLITLDLADLLPAEEQIVTFDLKDHLVQGMVLMEKPFRTALKEMNWSVYSGKIVAVHCSADALVPKWAYMLVATYLTAVTQKVHFGTTGSVSEQILLENVHNLNSDTYVDARVVVKGCGDKDIPACAYMAITQRLAPIAKSIMYGEPCSTVPVYKRPKTV